MLRHWSEENRNSSRPEKTLQVDLASGRPLDHNWKRRPGRPRNLDGSTSYKSKDDLWRSDMLWGYGRVTLRPSLATHWRRWPWIETKVRVQSLSFLLSVVAAWLSGNALVFINIVALRRARLVLGWVTVRGYTILLFNQITQAYSA